MSEIIGDKTTGPSKTSGVNLGKGRKAIGALKTRAG